MLSKSLGTLINEDYSVSVDIDRHQSNLEHASSNTNFSIGTVICMLPSNFNLSIGKTVRYNNNFL